MSLKSWCILPPTRHGSNHIWIGNLTLEPFEPDASGPFAHNDKGLATEGCILKTTLEPRVAKTPHLTLYPLDTCYVYTLPETHLTSYFRNLLVHPATRKWVTTYDMAPIYMVTGIALTSHYHLYNAPMKQKRQYGLTPAGQYPIFAYRIHRIPPALVQEKPWPLCRR